MKLDFRCSDMFEGEVVDTYLLSAKGFEEELENAILYKARDMGYPYTKQDIACVEVVSYHSRVFTPGVSTGCIAIDINKELDLIWVDCAVADEDVLTSSDKLADVVKAWLGVEF